VAFQNNKKTISSLQKKATQGEANSTVKLGAEVDSETRRAAFSLFIRLTKLGQAQKTTNYLLFFRPKSKKDSPQALRFTKPFLVEKLSEIIQKIRPGKLSQNFNQSSFLPSNLFQAPNQ
jgi:hypothetical protein